MLRNRGREGLKFRRQVPIGPYVVDFACYERRLVVEADGPHHDAEADAQRDAWLTAHGYRVLRASNAEIVRTLERMLDACVCRAPKD